MADTRNNNSKMFTCLCLITLANLFEFSQQSNQCQQRFLAESDGKYKFVLDCSNLGLETMPKDISELTTILYLNGNRLNKIDKGAFDKLTQITHLDLSGNDLTSLPQGIFEKTPNLKTIDLRRNKLHCDWRVWWLVNFTKTLDQFYGHCVSPPSLRRRDVRKLTEKDVIVDCESKRKLNKNSKDGHYKFSVAGTSGNNIELLIYCHNMQSDAPKEYLSLPSGKQGNFISSASTRVEGCFNGNVSWSAIPQFTGFDKVRILLRSLSILPDDFTFSSSTKKVRFGDGRICGVIDNSTTCIGADAKIDLRGTPFKIKGDVNWQTKDKRPIDVVRKSGGAVVEIKCSMTCGGCSPSSILSLEPMNSQLIPYEACTRPLGLQYGRILSANITASSFLDRNFLPSYARLHGNGHGGWCAAKQDKVQFIQVDLGTMHTISGVSTQGYKMYSDWVTSYKLQYINEDDDIWKEYTLFGNPKVFQGNFDSNTVVTHWLSPRLRARSVRINPYSWYNGDLLEHRVCLRFELYGCKSDVSSYTIKLGNAKPCLVPVNKERNITDGEQITFDSKCSGKNFMFQLKDEAVMVHTLSGYCLDMSRNATAVLRRDCSQSRFRYQRIGGTGSTNNFIIKDEVTKMCVRLKRAKNKLNVKVVLKKCNDIFQILLILSKTGVVPLKPHFKELREARKVDMWSSQLFTCEFSSDPPSLFEWSKEVPLMKGGKRLHGENFKVFSNGTMLVKNVTWSDRGNYFCNVLNSEGSEARLVELDVHAIQRFVQLPSSQTTIVGRSVKFDCKVEGIPPPRILWKFKPLASKDFFRIDSLDQRRFKLSPDGSLTINNVHVGDKGVYVCVAKSPGKKANATADLVVYVPPRITLSAKKKNLYVGESTRVTCLATGDPYPKMKWFRLSDLNSTTPRERGQADGNISFERVSKKDEGIYVCEAENDIAKASATFQLVVTATCRLIYIRYSNIKPKKEFHIEKQQVEISCQRGFRLMGASKLQCTPFGNWTHPFPRCVDIDECNISATESAESSGYYVNEDTEPDVCHTNAICTNTVGSYSCRCEEGYVGNGFTCNWRSTTTKAPTTITTPSTTRHVETEVITVVSTLERDLISETDTTPTLLTTTRKTEDSLATLAIMVKNYTEGLISEFTLLKHLEVHSRTIEKLPDMPSKMKNLNASLYALESIFTVGVKEADRSKSHDGFADFISVISNLLSDVNSKVWTNLRQSPAGASQVMSMVDQYCRRHLENIEGLNTKNDLEIIAENLVVKIHDLKSSSNLNGVELNIASHEEAGSKPKVILQNEIIANGKRSTAILVSFKTLSNLLSNQLPNTNERNFLLSNVVSLTVSSIKDGTKLEKPIRLEFEIGKAVPKSPECVFWKFNTSYRGSWSVDGCRLAMVSPGEKTDTKIACECDHMTNFAVIERRPIGGQRKSPTFFILTLSLSVIIGCGISIFFAFITCISHLFFSSHIRSDRRIIMINICASILLGSTVFLSGALLSSFKLIKEDYTKYFCLVMSGSLQLFFVAFFSWMLAEAIQIFLSTKTVIDKSTGKLTLFYLLGWGVPVVVVGCSLVLIILKKIQITSWCWVDLSSYTHFLLTGVPTAILFLITAIFYALISSSLKKNNDLLNPFVQRYTRLALWLSPVLLILHVLTIIALAAYLTFNDSMICHYILGALYGLEGIFLVIYQCYVEKTVLARSGSMSPREKKRQHSYSVKDTITYGDETCIEDGSGKYLIRRPSKRSLQESGRNSVALSVGLGVSRKSDLDNDSDSNYFDMYGASQKFVSVKSSSRVPVVNEDDVDENGELLRHNEDSEHSSETYSDERETQLTSFEGGNPSKKPASHGGSVLSIETKARPPLQGIPVYFPGSAPAQHQLTLERPKDKKKARQMAEMETYDNNDIDACSSHNTRDSMDPDTISNISSELSSILKELEAFSEEPTPSLNRKSDINGAAMIEAKKSPSVWQRRRPPYERQGNVEMKDMHFRTVPSNKANWYGTPMKDSGDGLHKCTDDLQTSF